MHIQRHEVPAICERDASRRSVLCCLGTLRRLHAHQRHEVPEKGRCKPSTALSRTSSERNKFFDAQYQLKNNEDRKYEVKDFIGLLVPAFLIFWLLDFNDARLKAAVRGADVVLYVADVS
ncbi:hypothetical protein NDU88_007506 [Pleurodeles waltl]|uniref:Uncharacterized protein n=1 Tax=Pleurodeles waltl TaxID=8319 RepID=A0AAV7SSK5_PLEWA|nr:hypothetical protein NDU88_007506 [Pleurodeles waltl]